MIIQEFLTTILYEKIQNTYPSNHQKTHCNRVLLYVCSDVEKYNKKNNPQYVTKFMKKKKPRFTPLK